MFDRPSLRRLRALSALATAGALAATAPAVRAEPAPEPLPLRPFEVGALEVNPLAALVHRFGGQVQVGITGPFALVAAASWISKPKTSEYNDGWYDTRGVRGLSIEVGPRVYVPLGSHRRAAAWWWVGAAYAHDFVEVGGGGTWRAEPTSGIALDIGFHLSPGYGLYAAPGLGFEVQWGDNDSTVTPRVLLAVGWAL